MNNFKELLVKSFKFVFALLIFTFFLRESIEGLLYFAINYKQNTLLFFSLSIVLVLAILEIIKKTSQLFLELFN